VTEICWRDAKYIRQVVLAAERYRMPQKGHAGAVWPIKANTCTTRPDRVQFVTFGHSAPDSCDRLIQCTLQYSFDILQNGVQSTDTTISYRMFISKIFGCAGTLTSFSSHEVRPTNDLFRPHDCTHLAVVQVFYLQVSSEVVVLGI